MFPVIQSSSVEPIPEPEMIAKFEGKNVMEQVVRFFRTNYVRRFMLKRPFHKGQKDKTNEYKTLHVERIAYTTSHRFPSILRWFEVKSTEVVGEQCVFSLPSSFLLSLLHLLIPPLPPSLPPSLYTSYLLPVPRPH